MYIVFFLMGFFMASLIFVLTALYQGKKIIAKRKEAVKTFTKEIEDAVKGLTKPTSTGMPDSVAERLTKVKVITEQQFDLQANAEGPQKNAAHGRYKNGLAAEVKRLEEEKKDILNSIIADGHDPVITVVTDNGNEEMQLSQFMVRMGITTPPPPKEDNISKFTVYKGGKDENNNTIPQQGD